MKTRHVIFVILAVFFLSSSLLAHTFYKWVDEKGAVNYTDDYNNIPPTYRGRAEIEWVHEEGTIPSIQKMTPKEEKQQGDISGLSEGYWRDKVRPWKEFLKAAEVNYEKAHEKFMEKAMELSAMRYGPRTQFLIKTKELDSLKVEMIKYADQISEAKEALEKISKEAEEVKADPEWLK